MEEQNKEVQGKKEYIDLRLVFRRLWENKKKFFVVLPVAFVLSCAYVLCLPRYYSTDVKLVPEIGGSDMGGTLGDLASSFGIDLSSSQGSDAISPLLYPDLMEDNGFVAKLFNIRVKSDFDEDMPIDTTYYAYLRYFQKKAPWTPAVEAVKKLFTSKSKIGGGGSGEYDPYNISRTDLAQMEKIRKYIAFNIDKKTAVITLTVKTQDPYICRQLADSIKNRLQEFITDYRTRKARVDVEYYEKLTAEAHQEYTKAVKTYADLVDSEWDVMLQSVKSKRDDLENEMQMKYNTYQTLQTQLQAAQAKVQERTPAFTLLKGAAVPLKPASPKRMLIVIGLCFLAFIATCAYILKDDVKRQLS